MLTPSSVNPLDYPTTYQAKIDFLNKIINLVGICLGEQVSSS